MFRGCRSIILAVAGLALVGAAPNKQGKAEAQNAQSAQTIDGESPHSYLTIPESPIPFSPDTGCERGKDNRKSDLCAQWKAADAAADGAKWGMWQLWIGVVGLMLGAVTMAAAIAAALYAKRAAIATEETVSIAREAASEASNALVIAGRNADAAVKLADQAEATAKTQLRAYLAVDMVGLASDPDHLGPNPGHPQIYVRTKNFGQTSASGVIVRAQMQRRASGETEESVWQGSPPQLAVPQGLTPFLIDCDILPERSVQEILLSAREEKATIILNICCIYHDIFGQKWMFECQGSYRVTSPEHGMWEVVSHSSDQRCE